MISEMYVPLLLLSSALFIPSHGSLTREMSIATNNFAVELLKTSFNSGNRASNTIISPLSLYTVLAITQQGAGGNTENEVTQVLHAQPAETRVGFRDLINNIKDTHNDIQIEFSNKLFIATGFNILPEFKNMTVEDFKSDIESVDFTQPEAAARTINDWVSQSTHQRIQQLVSQESLTPDTALMLLNAVFFSGEWDKIFHTGSTSLKEFHTLSGSSKNVSTMHLYREILHAGHCSHIGAKFVHLLFRDEQYSMLVVVPDEREGLVNVTNNLQGERLYNLTRHQELRYVNLALPKFKFETTSSLNDVLRTMGLSDMFGHSANFSGIAEEALAVSDVRQKAEIEVDEKGAKASAATSVRFYPMSAMYIENTEDLEVKADHPFLFFIVDKANSVPLFSGWSGDP
ncbi:leukocyte elastase inhibitor-like isoform X1 [Periplaneta americana]|uniref:leukocyte elastase inhibitor-like isoform X1 n=1 Tax=Periplaneta americana TaxID=6978 RepID=UPI0037E8B64E